MALWEESLVRVRDLVGSLKEASFELIIQPAVEAILYLLLSMSLSPCGDFYRLPGLNPALLLL